MVLQRWKSIMAIVSKDEGGLTNVRYVSSSTSQ